MKVVSFSCGITHNRKLAPVINDRMMAVTAIPFFDAICYFYYHLVYN
jgi:hypothetical protein